MKNKGFTLIELLVVIATIGILASVVIASIKDAVKKAEEKEKSNNSSYVNDKFTKGDRFSSTPTSSATVEDKNPYIDDRTGEIDCNKLPTQEARDGCKKSENLRRCYEMYQ